MCHILLFLLIIRFAFLGVDIAVKDFGLPAYTWSQAQPPVKREQIKFNLNKKVQRSIFIIIISLTLHSLKKWESGVIAHISHNRWQGGRAFAKKFGLGQKF